MHSIYLKAPLNFFLKGLPTNVTEQIMVGNQFFGSAAQSAEHAYMYGTRLKMLANDQVIFENHFLPTGSVIYRWDELYGPLSVADSDVSESAKVMYTYSRSIQWRPAIMKWNTADR